MPFEPEQLPLKRSGEKSGFNAIATASLGLMQGVESAIAISLFTGISTIWATLLMFELVIKTCPEGAEGTVYAVAVALSNVAASLGLVLGGGLYDGGLSFAKLALLGAGTRLLGLVLVPFLPERNLRP